MTTTIDPPSGAVSAAPAGALDRAEGIELLGPVHGSGYRDGVSLVRRADGQIVQLGPLLYTALEAADGRRTNAEIAERMTSELRRQVSAQHVDRIAVKLATQGLLAGTEAAAPPRRNPLLALRWKVLVTNPTVTRRLTAPFAFLFRPWVMWPVLAAFVAVVWFVLFDKGVAGATSQAFHSPGLLLLVFAIGVASAGFHELGHAAGCRYGGATPGGMGVGLYLVWPAFYTDVTDAYRLDRRSRLRVDLAGLYFNAVMAVAITCAWLFVRTDALLLVVALQLLLMVKQLSPVIRADGYHILADLTGVPDLFAHIGPTMRRLIPGRREPSALTGRARAIVTAWVLVVIPVLAALMFGAVLLLPRIATSAWDSGRVIAAAMPHDASHHGALTVIADVLRLVALVLPVLGSALVAQRIARGLVTKARSWSHGSTPRRGVAAVAGLAVIAGLAWAWWPAGQYQRIRPSDSGTLPSFVSMLGTPASVTRPLARTAAVPPGRYLALAMIPKQGVSSDRPAFFALPGRDGEPPIAVLSNSPRLAGAPSVAATTPQSPAPSASPTAVPSPTPSQSPAGPPAGATAFPCTLPSKPGPGGTQALATNQTDGGVVYKVAYALVTIDGGDAVTNSNSAYAIANCNACTTVAVSFQLVLVVGQSNVIMPVNAAGAINYDCPQCMTTAIADQMVVTLTAQPAGQLDRQLKAALRKLNALSLLGAGASPDEIAGQVVAIQQQIEKILSDSGLLAQPFPSTSASPSTAPTTSESSQPAGGTSSDAPKVQSSTPARPAPVASASGVPSPRPSEQPTTARSATPSPTPTPTATSSPSASTSASG
jgi:putative peptide zinc metalloprotease protein